MSGFITKKEVIENKDLIVKAYGKEFYEICLKSEGKTFLGLLVEYGKI
jgi:hypothetical protein